MEIIFLGTSSAVHSYNRNHPSIALKAFGEVILFDCGEGTQRQLIFGKISPMKITKIFISHFHGDHILGLPGLLQSMNFGGRENSLDIYGPKGIFKIKEAIFNLSYCSFDFSINFHEITEGTIIENENYIINSVETKHNLINLSYSIEEKKKPRFLKEKAIKIGVPIGPAFGKLHNGEEININGKVIKPEEVLGEKRKGLKVSYSGDTKFSEKMIELSKNSTVLIHEATYISEDADKANENFHSTAKDAAMVAKKSNSEKLILTHISTRYSDTDDILKEAREVFKNTEIAKDLMCLRL